MKILLVQTSFLGDTILSTPLIAALKKLHPQAELWMMTTPPAATLVERDPLLTGVIPFAKRESERGLTGLWRLAQKLHEMHFDRAYSLHRSARTSLLLALSRIPERIGFHSARLAFLYSETRNRPQHLHDVRRNLALLGDPATTADLPDQLRLFAPEKNELPVTLQAELPAPGSYVLMVPGSAWETKRWSAAGYREVAQYLRQKGWQVVLLGNGAEVEVCREVAAHLEVVNLAGRSDLASAIYLAGHARLMICNDSMALHLASACKLPTVAIFCATVPEFGFGPWQNQAVIVEKKDLPCRPCARHGSRQCPNQTRACMDDLTAAEVIEAIDSLLADIKG
ncbi:MAG: lipopolysaccharide heptosyltransferase II [Deltaproteobacteria bacterium]|nr:lipopolysaccharide heptosyltransferase II [Deltaproteobacteria bacterium]